MERRNSASLSSLTGMTQSGTPMTPTKGGAEKKACRVRMQIQQLADEQERIQKQTFTHWMNKYLKQKDMKVENLFEDIKDGVCLLSLLEVLSGEKLKMEKRKHTRIHHVNNISTALSFLEQKKIKLVNINAANIADGKPSIVLALIRTIISYFQIEDTFLQTATDESGEQLPLSPRTKFPMNIKKDLLAWTGIAITKKYGIKITNFGKCWRDGLAFNAMVHNINPDLVDFNQCRKQSARTNLEQAFYVAKLYLGIPSLLIAEDVDVEKPDERSVMTYVAQYVKAYPGAGVDPSIEDTFVQTATDESGEQLPLSPIKKFPMNAKKDLLAWPGNAITKKYGIEIPNRGKRWRDGPALNAMVHTVNPDLVDSDQCRKQNAWTNFSVAESQLGIPSLLSAEDVDVEKPDERSVMPYVAQYVEAYPGAGVDPSIEDTFVQTATDESGEQLPLSPIKKFPMNAKKDLLAWPGNAITKKYGIEIPNRGKRWRDGPALNAMVHTVNPDLVDSDQCRKQNAWTNFSVAESQLGIPSLLSAEDVDVEKPDERSVMPYVAQYVEAYPGAGVDPSIEDTFVQTATDESGEQLPLSPIKKFPMNAKKDLLAWPGNAITKKYGIEIPNRGKRWRDGPALNAIVHTGNPDLVDSDQCRKQNAWTNFSVAESQLGIPSLLFAEDVDVEKPDERSVMPYVAQYVEAYPGAGLDPSKIETNRKCTYQHCYGKCPNDTLGGMPICGNKRTQDTSTVEFGVESEIRIVLIGRTGSGKSATGNTILRKKNVFESSVATHSVTSKCNRGETIRAGKKVIVVDTPGLFDTGMSNEQVTKEICKCLGITSPGPHVMVLVVGIGRFTKEEQDTVQHFVDHFGEGMLRYMILLFTKEDALSKENISIDQYVEKLPTELKPILDQCENRYIAFDNDAVGQKMTKQVNRFFGMVDVMQTTNGRSYYTNELFAEAEVTLQRRMRDQQDILEKQKHKESDKIKEQLEKKHEKELEKQKVALTNYLKELHDRFPDISNIPDRREMENHIISHQVVVEEDIAKVKERLQRECDEANRRYEKLLEEKNKEIREQVKKKEIEYESKMTSENLRERERDDIELERGGVLDDISRGFKRLWEGGKAGGRAILKFLGF